jgi:hypothetical protein
MPQFAKHFSIGNAAILLLYSLSAIVVSFGAGKSALGNILAGTNAASVAQIDSDHHAGLSAQAEAFINTNERNEKLDEAFRLAKQSVKVQPLNTSALNAAAYALSRSKTPQASKAKKLQSLAFKTTRRSINVIRWLISDSQQSGDLPAILRYYDTGMRLGPDAQDILFPQLLLAMEVPEFHPMFSPYIKQNAPWLLNFMGFITYNSKNADKIGDAIILAGGLPKNNAPFRQTEGNLLGLMTAQKRYAAAKRFYLSLSDSKSSTLGNLAFNQDTVTPIRSALVWNPVSSATAGGDFAASGIKGKFQLQGFALAGEKGPIATRLLFLPAGTYSFKATRQMNGANENASAIAVINCVSATSEQKIWAGDLITNKGYDVITIPAGCETQNLTINLSAGDGANGAEILFSDMALTRQN